MEQCILLRWEQMLMRQSPETQMTNLCEIIILHSELLMGKQYVFYCFLTPLNYLVNCVLCNDWDQRETTMRPAIFIMVFLRIHFHAHHGMLRHKSLLWHFNCILIDVALKYILIKAIVIALPRTMALYGHYWELAHAHSRVGGLFRSDWSDRYLWCMIMEGED